MPRELTEREKKFEKNRLLESGKQLFFRFGIKRVSVDDIAKEAGIAKGSFYHYFSSKDEFIYDIIYLLHDEMFTVIEESLKEIVETPKEERKQRLTKIFGQFLASPAISFFILEHEETNNFLARYSKDAMEKVEELEQRRYQEIFDMLGIKDKDVGVIQNFVHIMVFGMSKKGFLNEGLLDETVGMMFDGLLNYLEV